MIGFIIFLMWELKYVNQAENPAPVSVPVMQRFRLQTNAPKLCNISGMLSKNSLILTLTELVTNYSHTVLSIFIILELDIIFVTKLFFLLPRLQLYLGGNVRRWHLSGILHKLLTIIPIPINIPQFYIIHKFSNITRHYTFDGYILLFIYVQLQFTSLPLSPSILPDKQKLFVWLFLSIVCSSEQKKLNVDPSACSWFNSFLSGEFIFCCFSFSK